SLQRKLALVLYIRTVCPRLKEVHKFQIYKVHQALVQVLGLGEHRQKGVAYHRYCRRIRYLRRSQRIKAAIIMLSFGLVYDYFYECSFSLNLNYSLSYIRHFEDNSALTDPFVVEE